MKQIISEIDPKSLSQEEVFQMYDILVNHFGYSIKDINSYNELTDEEKEFIPKDLFEKITKYIYGQGD